MIKQKRIILFIGSLKGESSSSAALGNYLLKYLTRKNVILEKIAISLVLANKEKIEKLLKSLKTDDVILFSNPLYVDSPPCLVLELMEMIYKEQRKNQGDRQLSFFVISNCGYPEASHNNTAISIYKKFAKKSNLKYLGAIEIGMGLLFQHNRITVLSLLIKRLRTGFKLTAQSILENRIIPNRVNEVLSKNIMPICLYNLGLSIGIRYYKIRNKVGNINFAPLCCE